MWWISAVCLLSGCSETSQQQTRETGGSRPQTVAEATPEPEPQTEPGRLVTIQSKEYRFEPNIIQAAPGERLSFQLVNEGDEPHALEFDLPTGMVEMSGEVPKDGEGTVEISAPQAPGEYPFYCSVGNHPGEGMLVVR